MHITRKTRAVDVITARSRQLTALLACCCRRKRFISSLLKQAGDDCILLAVRGCDAAQEALCLMLEWRLLPNEEARLQIINALESTESGKERYAALCQRQKNLQELVSEFAYCSDMKNRLSLHIFALFFILMSMINRWCILSHPKMILCIYDMYTFNLDLASNERVDLENWRSRYVQLMPTSPFCLAVVPSVILNASAWPSLP